MKKTKSSTKQQASIKSQDLPDIGSCMPSQQFTPEETADLLMKQIGLEKSVRALRQYKATLDGVRDIGLVDESADFIARLATHLEEKLRLKNIASKLDPDKAGKDWILREMIIEVRKSVLGERWGLKKRPGPGRPSKLDDGLHERIYTDWKSGEWRGRKRELAKKHNCKMTDIDKAIDRQRKRDKAQMAS